MKNKTSGAVVSIKKASPQAQFRMIDVGHKRVTRRRAVAEGRIVVGRAAFKKIQEKSLEKGDVLALAEIAGIQGAKKTPDLLPMCHTLPIDQVTVHCVPEAPDAIRIYAQVAAHAKTGVEMEALMAVQTALATVWDLVKGTTPDLMIEDVRLLVKEGGKGGLWINPDGIPDWLAAQCSPQKPLKGLKAAVIVMSDRAAAGRYEDKSGPALKDILFANGAQVSSVTVLPDSAEKLAPHLKKMTQKQGTDVIIVSGGTGFSARDITPETLAKTCDRLLPSLGDMLRQDGAQVTPKAWLSRSTAGVLKGTLVIALPGSPKAVTEGMAALLPVLPHAVDMIRGGSKHD